MGNLVTVMNECEKSWKVRCGRRAGTIRSRAAVALAVLCLFGAACSEDPSSAVVRLTIAPPRPSLPQMRAAEDLDEAESRVGTVRVLVFEQEGGRYLYRNMAEGEQVRFSGSATRFEVRLPGTPNPVKLALVCNYGDAFERYAPAAGSDEATVRERIGRSFSGLTGDLPMYGEIPLPSGLRADAENRFDVRLLRAVARVDVTKALDAGSRPFRIGEVYVYRPNDKIRIVPDDMGSAESPRVTAPSVFEVGGAGEGDRRGTRPGVGRGNLSPGVRGRERPGGAVVGGTLHRRRRVLRRAGAALLLPD